MPLVFVHGVNVRKDKEYLRSEKVRDAYFRNVSLKDVVSQADQLTIVNPYWGGDAANIYLPHNHSRNLVIYTGTHDNDTTMGWWRTQDDHLHAHVQQYLGVSGDDIAWDFIRAVLHSAADTAIMMNCSLGQIPISPVYCASTSGSCEVSLHHGARAPSGRRFA